jgi:hypothetical protein
MYVTPRFESIIEEVERENKLKETYSHFLLNYLLTSDKDKVKITNLTLQLNDIHYGFNHFMDNQRAVDYGYAVLIKQRKRYAIFKLTSSAYLMADTFTYDKKIVKRSYLFRIIFVLITITRFVKSIFTKHIPKVLRSIFSEKNFNLSWKIIVGIGVVIAIVVGVIVIYEQLEKRGVI